MTGGPDIDPAIALTGVPDIALKAPVRSAGSVPDLGGVNRLEYVIAVDDHRGYFAPGFASKRDS